MKELIEQTLSPSPLSEISQILPDRLELRVFVKRDDLLKRPFQGNKYRKLKYNLAHALENGYREIVSFGGAYSNHLHALSFVPGLTGLEVTCYVRGEADDPENPTLRLARDRGVRICPMERGLYRKRFKSDFLEEIKAKHPDGFIVPEGGTNQFALQGIQECAFEVMDQLGCRPDYCLAPVGSGGTIAGLMSGFGDQCKVVGITAFAGENEVKAVETRIRELAGLENTAGELQDGFHFGGFAKMTPGLFDVVTAFKEQTGILLDPLYTSKMVYAFMDLAEKGYFEKGSTIVLIHTGGLQGWDGFRQRYGHKYRFTDFFG